jgi:hypothetical protein
LCFDKNDGTKKLEPYIAVKNKYNFCENRTAIFLNTWALKELKVPVYIENRVYLSMQNSLQVQYPSTTFDWNYYQSDYSLKLRQQKP